MKQQSEERIKQFIKLYPVIGHVRNGWKGFDDGPCPGYPTTTIVVQRPDTYMMHLQAKNYLDIERCFLSSSQYPNYKGNQSQYLLAVDFKNILVASLWKHKKEEFETMSEDIFSKVEPENIRYLLWVTYNEWFPDDSIKGKRFGELSVIVYPRRKDITWMELKETADKEKKEREEAYLYFPKIMPDFPGIDKAIFDGCKLHGFSSGGGLRVVSLSKDNKDLGYGEHPHVEEALVHLNDDYLAGGRPYSVYGTIYPHYLTGESLSSSNIDYWLRRGSSFDATKKDKKIEFVLSGYEQFEIPKEIQDKCEKTPNVPVIWKQRGFVYKSVYVLDYFADHKPGTTTSTICSPLFTKNDNFFYDITKTGIGNTFWEAVKAAFDAPSKETPKYRTPKELFKYIWEMIPKWKDQKLRLKQKLSYTQWRLENIWWVITLPFRKLKNKIKKVFRRKYEMSDYLDFRIHNAHLRERDRK